MRWDVNRIYLINPHQSARNSKISMGNDNERTCPFSRFRCEIFINDIESSQNIHKYLTYSGSFAIMTTPQNKEKRGNNMNYEIALTLGPIAALILAIFLYIKVMPRKLDGTFDKPILQFLHDFFHFKKLYVEEVLKFIFTLATIACVVTGALLLISVEERYSYSYYSYSGYTTKESTFWQGLVIMIGGPIALRLVYEFTMMFILLVKNVIEINNKLKANSTTQTGAPAAPAAPTAPAAPAAAQNPFREASPEPSNTPPAF